MQSKPAKHDFIDLSLQGGETGREDCQEGWHLLLNRLLATTPNIRLLCHPFDASVLDVGAGLGRSKGRIRNCTTQDPATVYDVDLDMIDLSLPVEKIANRSFDVVTAFDVIEHVVEDVDFLDHLCRIAKRWVFITTPNFNVSKAANGCHCREYTPVEFAYLTRRSYTRERVEGRRLFWVGDGKGLKARKVGITPFLKHVEPHQACLIKLWEDR